MARKALGRGLKALIPDTKPPEGSSLQELPIDRVLPGTYQPRQDFDADRIRELADSIRSRGIIQPLIVKPAEGGRYELIAGERRWRAAREAGLSAVPVVIRPAGDAETLELALVENLQREDLNPMETARAYRQLTELFDLTQEEVASQVGKDRSSVANHLRLLKLPAEIQEELTAGRITMGHARALLSAGSREAQIKLCKAILKKALSVRQTEALVQKAAPGSGGAKKKGAPTKDIYIKDLEGKIRGFLGTKVTIRPAARGGSIEISYYSTDELNRLADILTGKA